MAWYVIWVLFISNSPLTDKFITATEKNYFKNFISTSKDIKVRNYRDIFKTLVRPKTDKSLKESIPFFIKSKS